MPSEVGCEYCKGKGKSIIWGKDLNFVKASSSNEQSNRYKSVIMQGKDDERAGIMFFDYGTTRGYIDINCCPICGRKLGE